MRREQPQEQRQPPQWRWWLAGAGLVGIIIAVASLLSPYVRHQLALSLFRQKAPYTQLAFDNAGALPATVARGKAVQLSFAVTNDEGKWMNYKYVVSSGSGAKLQPLSSSTKTIAPGAAWNVEITVFPKCTGSTCRVQVSLPRQGESIDFMYREKSAVKEK